MRLCRFMFGGANGRDLFKVLVLKSRSTASEEIDDDTHETEDPVERQQNYSQNRALSPLGVFGQFAAA